MSLIPRLMAVIPFGIGVTVLFFLWSSPFDQFGSPPLFFRIFGSFIALGFVLFGVALFVVAGKVSNPREMARSLREVTEEFKAGTSSPNQQAGNTSGSSGTKVGYDCPNCGAALGSDADVSPSGDAKCQYCDRWFNVHRG